MNAASNEVIARVTAKYDPKVGLHGRWRPICGHFVHVRLANSLAIGCDGQSGGVSRDVPAHVPAARQPLAPPSGHDSQLDSPLAGANACVREFPASSRAPMKYPG
jgi:hypothetical protein